MGAHTKKDLLLLGALIIVLTCEGGDVSRTDRPWETRACRQLYAITNEVEPPVTKVRHTYISIPRHHNFSLIHQILRSF